MVDRFKQKRISGFRGEDLDYIPEGTLTDDFIAGLREGHDLACDQLSIRLGTVAIVMFALGLLLGGMLP